MMASLIVLAVRDVLGLAEVGLAEVEKKHKHMLACQD